MLTMEFKSDKMGSEDMVGEGAVAKSQDQMSMDMRLKNLGTGAPAEGKPDREKRG